MTAALVSAGDSASTRVVGMFTRRQPNTLFCINEKYTFQVDAVSCATPQHGCTSANPCTTSPSAGPG